MAGSFLEVEEPCSLLCQNITVIPQDNSTLATIAELSHMVHCIKVTAILTLSCTTSCRVAAAVSRTLGLYVITW